MDSFLPPVRNFSVGQNDFTVISLLAEGEWQNNSCLLATPIIINSKNVRAITQSVATIFRVELFRGVKLENRAKYNFHQFINYA